MILHHSDNDFVRGFEQRVSRFINENRLLEPRARVIVALSGGADSVALAAVLVALGYDCVAAHCNFHLRGQESMRDCGHAHDIAHNLGIKIVTHDFDVRERMSAADESVEMACRSLRYEWFSKLIAEYHAEAVAVGHHREDNVETLLLNLLRTTGISGLAAMRPRRDNVIRPLLDVTRGEIERYLHLRSLTWIVDSTNASDDFRRNRLRNHIVPQLEKLFPGATDSIAKTARMVAQNKMLYDFAIAEMAQEYLSKSSHGIIDIDVEAIIAKTGNCDLARTIVYELIKTYGFNGEQADDIVRGVANKHTGVEFYATDKYGCVNRGHFLIEPKNDYIEDDDEVAVSLSDNVTEPVTITVRRHDVCDFDASALGANMLALDVEALEDNPQFVLRHCRRGDRIAPYGMNGRTKLVSDILTQAHLSPSDKKRQWLLCRDEVILWVVGIRASMYFAINDKTKQYLTLTVKH